MLLLKTVGKDGSSYNGFKWPLEVGAVVTAPDWEPTPQCGNGLHGLPWGEGNGGLLNWSPAAQWIVFEAPDENVICFDKKAKCPTARIVHVGTQQTATSYIYANGGQGRKIVGCTATAGDKGTATAGNLGTATAGNLGTATAGWKGTATAGDEGVIIIRWHDGKRYHVAVGVIGEDGLLPNVAYRFDASVKKFVPAKG